MENWLTAAGAQKRVYEAVEGAIKSVENHDLVLYNLADDFKNVKALGEAGGVRFLIEVYTGKSGAGGNNGGVEQNATVARVDVQGAVAAVENSEMTEMTDMLDNTGTGAGVWEDEATRRVRECTENLAKRMQRYMCVSHGTGRVGVVDASTVASTTFVASVNAAYPYGLAGIEANEKVDIYDLDSGGAAQYSGVLINSLNYASGLVSTDTTMTLTAGWSVYLQGRYGLGINGLRNLIDDGTYAATIHGLTRSTYPSALNSVVENVYSGGNRVELTQDMLDKNVNQVHFNGGRIEFFYGNSGVNNTFNRSNVTLRQYNAISGKGPFKQELGQATLGSYSHKGRTIPFHETDDNCLPGMLYGFSKGLLRKYVASPIKFMMKDGAMWSRAIGANGRPVTGYQAVAKCQMNIGIQKPSWAMLINGLRDRFTGRDA